jgi:hypothetical protein
MEARWRVLNRRPLECRTALGRPVSGRRSPDWLKSIFQTL